MYVVFRTTAAGEIEYYTVGRTFTTNPKAQGGEVLKIFRTQRVATAVAKRYNADYDILH